MKNFKHILMSHEIFMEIFDGPRNIFLCSPLVILIFKSAKTAQTGYQGDLKKVRHVK